ncbi:hypothetical protein GCM10028773_04950 [Spirosoma koreense]
MEVFAASGFYEIIFKIVGKIVLSLAVISLPLALCLCYAPVHNLNEVLPHAVRKRPKKDYKLRSKAIQISLLNRAIVVDGLMLMRKDTANGSS